MMPRRGDVCLQCYARNGLFATPLSWNEIQTRSGDNFPNVKVRIDGYSLTLPIGAPIWAQRAAGSLHLAKEVELERQRLRPQNEQDLVTVALPIMAAEMDRERSLRAPPHVFATVGELMEFAQLMGLEF
jgi:hypothetical protein